VDNAQHREPVRVRYVCMSASISADDRLTGQVVRDPASGMCVVEIHGRTTARTEMDIRSVVTKCLTESPAAIVLDLQGLTDADSLAAFLLPTLRQKALEVGTRLVCVGDEQLANRIANSAARWFVELYPTVAEARSEAEKQRKWMRVELAPPHDLSAVQARLKVGDFCLGLGLGHVLTRVRIITSELVGNAVEHAGGRIVVTAAAHDNLIHIRVADRSMRRPVLRAGDEPVNPRAPLEERGTGLRLVQQNATSWGVTQLGDGKAVWATIRASARRIRT
jgi:anti-sigma regulatory factor (Ser/Thr protein kinase)/anti-anti-sigma regulatory factor